MIKGLVNKLGVTKQIATDFLNAKRAGKHLEAVKIAAENGMDVKKAELLADAERQEAIAVDIFRQKENIVYSGDRTFDVDKPVESFVDVDSPDFTPNNDNLFGAGLYVTDQALIASSQGYNKAGELSWVGTPYETVTSFNEILPEGPRGNADISGINKGGAGVWKFDNSDLNFIDSTLRPSREVADIVINATREHIPPIIKTVENLDFNKIEEMQDTGRKAQRAVLEMEQLNRGRFQSPEIRKFIEDNPERFGNYSGTWDPEQLDNLVKAYTDSPDLKKFRENHSALYDYFSKEYGLETNVIDMLLVTVTPGLADELSYITGNGLWRLARDKQNYFGNYNTFEDFYRDYFGLVIGEDAARTNSFSNLDMKVFYVRIQALANRLAGSEFPEVVAQSRKLDDLSNILDNPALFANEEIKARLLAPFVDNQLINELIDLTTSAARKTEIYNILEDQVFATQSPNLPANGANPATLALIQNGYDGVRYEGGRLGVAGPHNAYVVWKPSKMKHLDVLTGERFPVNEAISSLAERDKFKYTADEISKFRDEVDGFKQGMGLIGMDPRMLDARKIDAMRTSRYGQAILKMIADESDPVAIWRTFLKEKSPNAAIRLAKASTVDEVWQVLRDAVDSGDPNMNIRELPNGWKDWASDTGFKVKQQVDRYIKQTAMMPESTYIMFDDPTSAIRNTENLLQVVGVRGAERDGVLRVLFKAIEEDTSAAWDDFFAAANETSLAKKMNDAGWSPEEIKAFTSYRRKGDEVTRWTLEDLYDDIPIEWFDEGDGPLRITQLLTGGGWLLEPEVIDELIKDVNPIISGLRKITKDHVAVGKVIDAERFIVDKLENLTASWVKPAALGAPLPFRYILRVVPEETLRVAFSGEFKNLGQYVAQIYSGHLNTDTFGRTIKSSAEVANEMATLEHLKFEYNNLKSSVKNGADDAKILRRIEKIEKKHGTAADIQARIDGLTAQLEDNLPGDQRALVNKVRVHVESTFRGDKLDDYMERSGVQEVVTRKVNDPAKITSKERAMRRSWVTAQARDIGEMAINADYRAVAEAMLDADPNELGRVAVRLFSGDLRKTYEAYTKNIRNVKEGWDWETLEAASSRMTEINTDIVQRTGYNRVILEAIARNEHAGQSLTLKTVNNVYETTPQFKQLVREQLLDNPRAPMQVPYYPLIKKGSKAERNNNFMYAGFGLYTKASAALSRNPLWGQAYWKRIIEMIPAMDANEAAAMISANAGKLPDHVMDTLNDSLPNAKGSLNRDEMSRIAEQHAREVTDGLLWNAQNNTSYFQYRHPLFFMFFDAYREQWTTWLKLMKNPANLHKVDLAVRSLKDFREPFAEGEEGILHNDPISGQQVITVPGSQWAFKWMGGDANLAIKTKNLSVVGSTYPGVGPGIAIIGSSWMPDWKLFADIKQKFMPFSGAGTSTDFRDYVIPQFAQLLAAGVGGVGSNAVPSLDFFWKTLEKFAGETTIKTKQASIGPIMRQLATQTDKYPMTPDGRKQLLEDADKLSSKFAIVRSLAKVFLPASSTTEYKVETKVGVTTQGILLDEIRKTENEVFARGGKLTEAVNILLDKYGIGIWAFFGSTSETNIPGLQPTKEFQDWVYKNKGILDKYPMAGAYLGPQTGEYNANVFVRQTQYDQRGPKEPKMSLEDGANLYAQAHWDYQMSTIPLGMENSPKAIILKNQVLNEIEQAFPGWSTLGSTADAQVKRRYQLQDIAKMILDPKVLTTPAGSALKEYMDKRKENIELMVSNSGGAVNNRNWIKNQSSYPLRQRLFNEGNAIAKNVPEFAAMWENVLVREFDTTDLKATDEAE
jgi:hypothetical protein